MPLTPEERQMRARIAAHTRWAQDPDRTAATSKGRAGLRAKFEREADPDGILPPDELERRVNHLMKAHMLRMSFKAKQARRKRAEAAAAQIGEAATG